jgi:hypothetical protein
LLGSIAKPYGCSDYLNIRTARGMPKNTQACNPLFNKVSLKVFECFGFVVLHIFFQNPVVLFKILYSLQLDSMKKTKQILDLPGSILKT